MDNSKEQIDTYRSDQQRVLEAYKPYLEAFGSASLQYGQQATKTIIALNGGALIALPAISGLAPESSASLVGPAVVFVLGLFAAILTTYLSHLNFNNLYALMERRKYKEIMELQMHYFGEHLEEEDNYFQIAKGILRGEWIVWLTFWGPHLCGILAELLFCLGAVWAVGQVG